MKVNELQIGDWVQNPLGWRAQVRGIRRIQAITDEFEWRVKIGLNDDTFTDLSLGEIEPIPLTPEILEKNYSSTPEWYFDGTNKYCLRISRYKDKWNFYYGRGGNGVQIRINIQYVHKLQHCLKLVGIKKDIVL